MKTSFEFTDVIARLPGSSIVNGLRDGTGINPDAALFLSQHKAYCEALQKAGVRVTLLDALEEFPDSVFVEDAALCIGDTAIALRPGAPTRAGETSMLLPTLNAAFSKIIELNGSGSIDGGDILVAETEVFAGLSARSNQAGIDLLADILSQLGYQTRQVDTPSSILHFKTACGLLDESTIFSTAELAATGCFRGYNVIEAIEGEEAAANLIRVNDYVLCSSGFPATVSRLEVAGYSVIQVDTSEAARVDGGLSCMSLRYNPQHRLS